MADLKKSFRNVMSHTPVWVRKVAVKGKVRESLGYVMSDAEARKCEKDLAYREKAVAERIKKYPKATEVLNGRMKELFSTYTPLIGISEEDKARLVKDMQFYYFAYGFRPHEYVWYDLGGINKDPKRHRQLISDAERLAFRFCANDFTNTVFADKASTYEALRSYYKRDMLRVNGEADRKKFLEYAAKHDTFVQKWIRGGRGQGVKKINLSDYPSADAYFDTIAGNGEMLLEELIVQNEAFSRYNPDSVNTVRLTTYITRNGVVTPFGFFRTGRKGSFLDNAATGGILSAVDTEKGAVSSDGWDEMGGRYVCHPESEVPFKGFQFPEWDKAVELCKSAAKLTPEMKWLSWDLAYSDRNGWDIVEVNTAGTYLHQAASLTGVRKKLKPIIDDMDLLIPFTIRG